MPLIKKIYLSKRIVSLLLILLILLISINLYTHKTLGEISNNTEFLTTDIIPKLILIQDITRNMGLIHANTLRHIASNDTVEMRKLEDVINLYYNENSNDLSKLKEYIGNEDEIEMYNEIIENRKKYEEAREDIISLSRENLIQSAYQINYAIHRPAYESYGESLALFTNEMQKEVKDSLDVSMQEVNETKRVRNLLIITGITVTLVLGFVTTSLNKKMKNENIKLHNEIDERKIAQNSLKASERKFAATLSSIGDAVIATDEKGIVTFMNESSILLTGIEEKDALGKEFDSCFHFVSEQDNKTVENAVAEVIRAGNEVKIFNRSILRKKSGEEIPIDDSAAPIIDENENVCGVVFVLHDVAEKRKSERIILESLKEKEILLKEVHHRVKNNLQIISSMLKLQSRHIKNKSEALVLEECQNRVRSMALVHQMLYKSNQLADLNFKNYLLQLSEYIMVSFNADSNKIKFSISGDDISLNIDTAIPCGLIVNELFSNSIKHAFPENSEGKINIQINHDGEHLKMIIEDNGIGLPEDFEIRNSSTLGMQLVQALIEQLDGTCKMISAGNGTKITIIIKYTDYKQRI